jgi:lysozyme
MERKRIQDWSLTKATALAKKFEGYHTTAYKCPAGVWTIGYGHTAGVVEGMTCTASEAELWLMEDLRAARDQAARLLGSTLLTEGEAAAVVDFVFNLGAGSFRRSTLLQKLLANDMDGASREFRKWIYSGGEVLPGLVRRRREEEQVFLGGE